MPAQINEKSNGSLGKVLFGFGVIGMVASTWRILFIHNDWILGAGVAACAAVLVISTWSNTTVKLTKGNTRDSVQER